MDKGFEKVYALQGGYREWKDAGYPMEKKYVVMQNCVECHTSETPSVVSDWRQSKHSENEVSCSVCHGTAHSSEDDISQAEPVKASRCRMCHRSQGDQFESGKHAKAWDAMQAMPTIHWQPMSLIEGQKGCGGCHKIGLKSDEQIKKLKEQGQDFGIVACDSCHTRHTFSAREARQPQACRTCHMGFDHPQWEMFESSKHGVKSSLKQMGVLPEGYAAPTCQRCHMPEGNHAVSTAWGFFGVRLPMPEDQQWAEARKTILKAIGVLDRRGQETKRFYDLMNLDVFRVKQKDWERERRRMLEVCSDCHSENFASRELEKGDEMLRRADLLMAEAIRIVQELYKKGRLGKEQENPALDILRLHDAPTAIEQQLFLMFMKHRMRTFQGAFHMNPDYTFWYGWAKMRRDLIQIKSMARELGWEPENEARDRHGASHRLEGGR